MGAGFIEINDMIAGIQKEKVIESDLGLEEIKDFLKDFSRYAVIVRKYKGEGMVKELVETLEEDYNLLDVQTVVILEEVTIGITSLSNLISSDAIVGVITVK